MQMVHCPHCANVIATPTANRLERILIALLQSHYVKAAFLGPHDMACMARDLELALGEVEGLDASKLLEHAQRHGVK